MIDVLIDIEESVVPHHILRDIHDCAADFNKASVITQEDILFHRILSKTKDGLWHLRLDSNE